MGSISGPGMNHRVKTHRISGPTSCMAKEETKKKIATVLQIGVGNGNTLQYSCLENSMERGAWQAAVSGVTKSQTQLNNWAHTHVPQIQQICL